MRRMACACALSIVVLGVAGTSTGLAAAASGPPLTKDQYVAQYNALCEAAAAKTSDGINNLPRNHDFNAVAHLIIPITKDRLEQTRKLVPPAGDATKVKKLIAAQQDALNTVIDDPESIAGGRVGQTLEQNYRKDVGKKADKLARAYGLESGICLTGQGPGSGGGTQDTRPCPGVGPCANGGGGGNTPPTAPCPGVGPCATAGGGEPPTGAGNTPPAQWTSAVCAAETTLGNDLKSEQEAFQSKSDPASLKQAFIDFLSGFPAKIKTVQRAIKQAGAPAVTNGKKITKTYLKTLTAIVKKVPDVVSMARALPTSSKDALQTAGKSIGTAIDDIKRAGDAKVAELDVSQMVVMPLTACGGIFPL